MAYYADSNPIKSVDGVSIPVPSTYEWSLSDVSASDAGRVESDDALMYKKRITQKRTIKLEWAYLETADVATVLQAFNPEYISVNYLDALTGVYRTGEFYVGDRSAPMYSAYYARWTNVSFNIIER